MLNNLGLLLNAVLISTPPLLLAGLGSCCSERSGTERESNGQTCENQGCSVNDAVKHKLRLTKNTLIQFSVGLHRGNPDGLQ